MRTLIFTIFISFVFSTFLKGDKYIIQIGVFKDKKNIKILKNRYKNNFIKIKKTNNNLNKVFIVCHDITCVNSIKQDIPSAFITKIIKDCNLTSHTPTNYENHENINSKTIIKSRNIFFK